MRNIVGPSFVASAVQTPPTSQASAEMGLAGAGSLADSRPLKGRDKTATNPNKSAAFFILPPVGFPVMESVTRLRLNQIFRTLTLEFKQTEVFPKVLHRGIKGFNGAMRARLHHAAFHHRQDKLRKRF